MLRTILAQHDGKGKLLDAVVYDCSAQHANGLSVDPGALVALTPKKYHKLFPGEQIPLPDKQPKRLALKKWIEKIDAAPKPKHGGWRGPGKSCTDELNAENVDKKKKSWQVNARADIHNYIAKAAKKRGLSITGLVETIMIDWLNRNELKKIPQTSVANGANKAAYILGQIAAKEYAILGNISFESYMFEVPGKKLTALRKYLIANYKFTEDIGELMKSVPTTLITSRLTPRNYIWFFAGFCDIDWAVIAEQKI